jgi:peroxiredoxin (alkyl hydroperoxide reductase subunit C)
MGGIAMKRSSALIGICLTLTGLMMEGVSVTTAASAESHAAILQRATAAEVGSVAPPFTLDAVVNLEFKKVSLTDYRGKWLVLFFYPADFSFVCPTEIKGFNKALGEFRSANAEVLAASVDSRFSHMAWIKSGALDTLDYPLLSDFSKQTARAYGVLDEEKSSAKRGLFIIDPNGVIQYRAVHSDRVGRSVEETLRVLKALQTEELCPINWKPGDKTIKK